MFVVMIEYLVPIEEIDALLVAHREWVSRCFDEGHFVVSGPQIPRTGGVIIARTSSRGELNRLLAQDPFHLAQAVKYTVTEFEAVGAIPELKLA